MNFEQYIALGDSFSTDLYPALDAGATSVAVALERTPRAGTLAPLGAASLFHRNDDARWPEFAGFDLVTRHPAITFRDLAEDGATIGDVFGEQLATLGESDARTLVTLTIGGIEVTSLLVRRPAPVIVRQAAVDIGEALEFLIDAIRRARPNGTLIVATVCDPSDGSALLPGVDEETKPVPLDALDRVNDRIRRIAGGTPAVKLADLHAHFLGHGVSGAEADRWYWRRSPLDPNAAGASEVRRVWLNAVNAGDA